ncbi:MAG: hypothetical protein HC938_15870 [Nitrospira sp.]|nr:hypothetical protein [Nitrospira sp.]
MAVAHRGETLKEIDRIPTLETELKGRPAITSVRATAKGLDIRVESPEKALPTILESANRLVAKSSLFSTTDRAWTMSSSPIQAGPSPNRSPRPSRHKGVPWSITGRKSVH